MATSGSVNYSITALDIINDAFENIGVLSSDRPLTANEVTIGMRKLNLIVKQWQGNNDFAPGLKMWARKRGYLFLQKNQGSYSLGPTGDNASASYVTTTISATEAAAQTVLSITSETGITAADYIGIELDTGFIQWTTVSSTGSGTVTIPATGLTSQASSGNRVFVYTTKLRRPLEILTAVLRDDQGHDVPVQPMTLENYESINSKTDDGTPSRLYYEAQLVNGVLYFDVEPDDVTSVLRIVYLSPIEDLDATTDEVDYPQVWFRPLAAQLSIDLSIPYNRPVSQSLQTMRDESLVIARNADPENAEMFFEPGLE
jgi:hypothetical protein